VNGGSHTEDAQPEWRSAMIDVSGMSLSDLAALSATPLAALSATGPSAAEPDESAFARALRRVAADAAKADEPIAGFNSAL
jgi:FXSXX-COOH protein